MSGHWTKEPPTEDGFYWFRDGSDDIMIIYMHGTCSTVFDHENVSHIKLWLYYSEKITPPAPPQP